MGYESLGTVPGLPRHGTHGLIKIDNSELMGCPQGGQNGRQENQIE